MCSCSFVYFLELRMMVRAAHVLLMLYYIMLVGSVDRGCCLDRQRKFGKTRANKFSTSLSICVGYWVNNVWSLQCVCWYGYVALLLGWGWTCKLYGRFDYCLNYSFLGTVVPKTCRDGTCSTWWWYGYWVGLLNSVFLGAGHLVLQYFPSFSLLHSMWNIIWTLSWEIRPTSVLFLFFLFFFTFCLYCYDNDYVHTNHSYTAVPVPAFPCSENGAHPCPTLFPSSISV